MSAGGHVVVLPTGYDPDGDEAPIKRDGAPPGQCVHREVAYDLDARRLVCRRCDADVDPLAWIARLAGDWQWYRTRVEAAKRRAEEAEENAERRVKTAQRLSARSHAGIPMPLGKRLARIASSIGRAHGELAEASAALAEVHDTGRASLADHHLRSAVVHAERARSSFEKLVRDHARPA